MKKKVCLTLFLLLCGCQKKEIINEEVKVEEPIVESYVDNNPITIGIYNDSSFDLITEYSTDFIVKKDIGVFASAYTNDKHITDSYFQDAWQKYYKNYTNIDNYKIGYYICFTLKDGTFIENTLLSPKDTTYFYPYLNTFLYDDVNQEKGSWYRHIEESEMKDNTILTSIKLQAEVSVDDISSPITLVAFTYDGTDDFVNNKYRGKSSYSILIKRKN